MVDCPSQDFVITASARGNAFPSSGFQILSEVAPGATEVDVFISNVVLGYGPNVLFALQFMQDAFTNAGPAVTWTVDDSSIDPNTRLARLAVPVTATMVAFNIGTASANPDLTKGQSIEVDGFLTFLGACTAPDWCAYGSSAIQPTQALVQVTPDLVAVAFAALGWPGAPVVAVLGALDYVSTTTLCASNPPVCLHVSDNDYLVNDPVTHLPLAYGKLLNCFLAYLWGLMCQCTPATGGAPPPLTPLPPIVAPPAGGGGGGVLRPPTPPRCDNSDICGSFNSLANYITQIQSEVGIVGSTVETQVSALQALTQTVHDLVVLIQRQAAPFGYVRGTCHPGLTGNGSLAVSDILGLSVTFTVAGWAVGQEMGTPPTLFDVGWVNVGDADGYRSRERIRNNPWTYFPIAAGEITTIGYSLNPLVTAEICELVKEP